MTAARSDRDRWVEQLASLGDVEQRSDRLILTAIERRVEILVTEHEWGDLRVPLGSFAAASTYALGCVIAALDQGMPFLVYRTYEFHPSATPELPDPWADFSRRVEEARRANPDATFGWFAYGPDVDDSP